MIRDKFISVEKLGSHTDEYVVVDVRKDGARAQSGLTIAGARYRHPFDAQNWWTQFIGRRLVVFCVHGHEVSQAVCGFLCDNGIDAQCLEGGFEAWRAAGNPVAPADGDGR